MFAFESSSFIVRRKCVRHSVTVIVNAMYSDQRDRSVMIANHLS